MPLNGEFRESRWAPSAQPLPRCFFSLPEGGTQSHSSIQVGLDSLPGQGPGEPHGDCSPCVVNVAACTAPAASHQALPVRDNQDAQPLPLGHGLGADESSATPGTRANGLCFQFRKLSPPRGAVTAQRTIRFLPSWPPSFTLSAGDTGLYFSERQKLREETFHKLCPLHLPT